MDCKYFGLPFLLILISAGCYQQVSDKPVTESPAPPKVSKTKKNPTVPPVDVPGLANKSAAAFDSIFGDPVKISPVRNNSILMPGEYREYRVYGHPKGLSVRFYRDKAKRFNLLLGNSEPSSENALLDIFKINVKDLKRVRVDPLSDTWQGRSKGISFKTAYAKRIGAGSGFVMLHAEVAK